MCKLNANRKQFNTSLRGTWDY